MNVKMLRNASGEKSFSFTMLFIMFNIVALWLLLFVFGGIIGVTVPTFDGASAMAVLTPLCATYFAGKYRRGIQKENTND